MTHFIYTDHATRRLKERTISRTTVEETYYHPDEVVPAEGESERAFRRVGKFMMVVTFERLKRKKETVKIISVHKKKSKGR